MADILSEKDVVLLYQAIAFGKASKLAQVIFTLENVMACIKRLLIDTVENKPSEVENGQPTSNEQSPIFNKEVPRVNLAGQRLNPKEETTPAETIVFHQKPRSTEISENISLAAKLHSMNVEANFTMNPCNSISERKGKSRKALPRHADTSLSEPKFTCEKCGYQTKRKDHYKRHCLTHTGDRPFKCHLCTFSSVDKYHLVRHLKSSMHSNGGNRSRSSQLECESCDYKTHQLGRMERHKRTHSGEKPFACSYCAYKAAQRATLDRHLLTHTGEKPFSCDKCDYSAADTKSLRFHTLQKHGDGEALHKCPECEYSTPILRYYKLHLRTHSEARPYLCDMCGYSAKRPHGLTKHYRAMHGFTMAETDGKTYRRETNPSEHFQTTDSKPVDGIVEPLHEPSVSTTKVSAPALSAPASSAPYTSNRKLVEGHHLSLTPADLQQTANHTSEQRRPIISLPSNFPPITSLTSTHSSQVLESCAVESYLNSMMSNNQTTSHNGITAQDNTQPSFPFYM